MNAPADTATTPPLCVPLGVLPEGLREESRRVAREVNPINDVAGNLMGLARADASAPLVPGLLAMLVQKKWAPGTVLPVAFIENTLKATRDAILALANRWHDRGANVRFAWTADKTSAVVRCARTPGLGYWSYLGTDCLMMARQGRQTMNLDSLTHRSPRSELLRVVPHEFGHALGFPHGQQTPEIVARINVEAVIAYYRRTQGWTREMAAAQFEALRTSEVELLGANADSVMTYPVPSAFLRPGAPPIPGGTDITKDDAAAARRFYPGKSESARMTRLKVA